MYRHETKPIQVQLSYRCKPDGLQVPCSLQTKRGEKKAVGLHKINVNEVYGTKQIHVLLSYRCNPDDLEVPWLLKTKKGPKKAEGCTNLNKAIYGHGNKLKQVLLSYRCNPNGLQVPWLLQTKKCNKNYMVAQIHTRLSMEMEPSGYKSCSHIGVTLWSAGSIFVSNKKVQPLKKMQKLQTKPSKNKRPSGYES